MQVLPSFFNTFSGEDFPFTFSPPGILIEMVGTTVTSNEDPAFAFGLG